MLTFSYPFIIITLVGRNPDIILSITSIIVPPILITPLTAHYWIYITRILSYYGTGIFMN